MTVVSNKYAIVHMHNAEKIVNTNFMNFQNIKKRFMHTINDHEWAKRMKFQLTIMHIKCPRWESNYSKTFINKIEKKNKIHF